MNFAGGGLVDYFSVWAIARFHAGHVRCVATVAELCVYHNL